MRLQTWFCYCESKLYRYSLCSSYQKQSITGTWLWLRILFLESNNMVPSTQTIIEILFSMKVLDRQVFTRIKLLVNTKYSRVHTPVYPTPLIARLLTLTVQGYKCVTHFASQIKGDYTNTYSMQSWKIFYHDMRNKTPARLG